MNSSVKKKKKKSLESSLASSCALSWCGNTNIYRHKQRAALVSVRRGTVSRHYGSYYFATVAPMPSRNLACLKKIHATCLFVMRVSPKIEQKEISHDLFSRYINRMSRKMPNDIFSSFLVHALFEK